MNFPYSLVLSEVHSFCRVSKIPKETLTRKFVCHTIGQQPLNGLVL